MKILMVSETMPAPQLGGLAKHAITQANTLIEQGHDVTLLGRASVDYESCRAEMGFKGRFLGALPDDKGWKEQSWGYFNPWRRPRWAYQVAQAILEHAAGHDVVHYHGNLPLVAAFIPRDINFVQTRHDQGSECLVHVRYRSSGLCTDVDPSACAACAGPHPNAVQRWVSSRSVQIYRHLSARALERHKTIYVSEAIRSNGRRVLPAAAFERSWVVHNFVDQQRLSRDTEGVTPPVGPGRPRDVLIASRLDDAKGVGPFLEHWQRLRPADARLRIVGDGPLRAAMEARYGGPAVEFLGHQPYAITLRMTAASHAAVIPSLCEEACSTTILEALYLGVPCYALARGGNPELSRYERWPGQLQLFESGEALVQGLVRYLETPPPNNERNHPEARVSSDVRAALPMVLEIYGR